MHRPCSRDSVSQDTGWVDLYRDSKFGSVSYRAKDGVCTLIVVALWGIPANSFWTLPKQIPTKYLPPQGCYSALTYRQSNNIASAWIPGQNSADMNEYIYTTVATTATSTAIHGMISWVY